MTGVKVIGFDAEGARMFRKYVISTAAAVAVAAGLVVLSGQARQAQPLADLKTTA